MKRFYVYMLLCADGSFYVGVTNDIERRVGQHEFGNDPEGYTFTRRPVRLVQCSEFQSVLEAIDWEKRLKNWSHAKKTALVERDWRRIHSLAQCRNASASHLRTPPLDFARGDESSARGNES